MECQCSILSIPSDFVSQFNLWNSMWNNGMSLIHTVFVMERPMSCSFKKTRLLFASGLVHFPVTVQ